MIPPVLLVPFRLGNTVALSTAGIAVVVSAPYWPLYILTGLVGIGEGLSYLAVIMIMTDSVPPTQYGLVHGLGGCLASLVRTIGPSLAGVVWELAPSWTVFILIAVVVAVEFGASFMVLSNKKRIGVGSASVGDAVFSGDSCH